MKTTPLYALTNICRLCYECYHCGACVSYDTDSLPTIHYCATCLQALEFKGESMNLSTDP